MRHEGAYEAVAYVIVGPMAQWMGMGVCVCVRCAYFTRPWETDLSCVSHTLDGWLDCDAIRWIAEMLLLLLLVDFKRVDCQPPMGGSGRTGEGWLGGGAALTRAIMSHAWLMMMTATTARGQNVGPFWEFEVDLKQEQQLT